MKDCTKCGRRIPTQWQWCGECQLLREKVQAVHHLEASSYRLKVQDRSSVLQALEKMRFKAPAPKPLEGSKTSTRKRRPRVAQVPVIVSPMSPEQGHIRQILERHRIQRGKVTIARSAHARVTSGLREWMAEEA